MQAQGQQKFRKLAIAKKARGKGESRLKILSIVFVRMAIHKRNTARTCMVHSIQVTWQDVRKGLYKLCTSIFKIIIKIIISCLFPSAIASHP